MTATSEEWEGKLVTSLSIKFTGSILSEFCSKSDRFDDSTIFFIINSFGFADDVDSEKGESKNLKNSSL